MSLKLTGIVLVSFIGFAQTPTPEPVDLWRAIRSALTTAQPSPNELIVNADDPVGDAVRRFPIAVRRPVAVGAPAYFEGVVRAYSKKIPIGLPWKWCLKTSRVCIDPPTSWGSTAGVQE